MVRQGEPYVFVSHSSKDNAESEALVAALTSHGVNVWIDRADIAPGTPYALQIVDAVESCSSMVVVLSAHANESRGVLNEIELAFNRYLPVFTVRIEDVKPDRGISFYLSADQWTDGFGPNRDANLARLAGAILAAPGHAGAASAQADTVPVTPTRQHPSVRQPARLFDDVAGTHVAQGPVEVDRVVRAFVGDMAPHFLASWERMDETKTAVSFSFPALLLGPIWFAYRKMYSLAFMNLGVCGLLALLYYASIFDDQIGDTIEGVILILCLAVALVVAMFANGFYRKHVQRFIAVHNNARNTVQTIRDRVTVAGGVNVGGAIGVAVLAFFMHLMLALALDPSVKSQDFGNAAEPASFEAAATDAAMPAADAAMEEMPAEQNVAVDAIEAAK